MYSQFCLPTRPRLFVKGEIRIEKGDFGGVLRGLDLVWESATPPTHIWEKSLKKSFFLPSLICFQHKSSYSSVFIRIHPEEENMPPNEN